MERLPFGDVVGADFEEVCTSKEMMSIPQPSCRGNMTSEWMHAVVLACSLCATNRMHRCEGKCKFKKKEFSTVTSCMATLVRGLTRFLLLSRLAAVSGVRGGAPGC